MKPTKYILILLSLFLTFSCDDKEEELPNELSLDWILLMKGGDIDFYVESCDGYVECDYVDYDDDVYSSSDCNNDEYEGYNCMCINYDNDCGECRLNKSYTKRVNSCDGYEICDNVEKYFNWFNILSPNECCFEFDDYPIVKYDEDGNTINEYDDDGNWMGETEIQYYYKKYLFNEYILYWNNDLDVCSGDGCNEESWNFSNYDYDIVIPSYIPKRKNEDCWSDNYCEGSNWNSYFHPNCDTPLDTTMMIGNKSLSFENMGWLGREEFVNSFGYIHYYPLDDFLILENGSDIDLSNYKIVDYQRKE